jgi:hypothetical protein
LEDYLLAFSNILGDVLEAADFLYTCAEIGVAIAGIAALVVAIGQRRSTELDSRTIAYVSVIVERGLAGAFWALLPIFLGGFELNTDLIWLLSSGFLALYIFSLGYRSYLYKKRMDQKEAESLTTKAFVILLVIGLIVAVVQVFHASGLLLQQSVWWYTLGVIWLLCTMGYMFIIFLRGTMQNKG